jgi:hypothetical protein
MTYTATYSPEDNKLRLYSSKRSHRPPHAGRMNQDARPLYMAHFVTNRSPYSFAATRTRDSHRVRRYTFRPVVC